MAKYHIGDKVNMFTVIGEVEYVDGKPRVLCRCECGTEKYLCLYNLSHTVSCGCRKRQAVSEARYLHGGTGTKLYRRWLGMNYRSRQRHIPMEKAWYLFENFRDWAYNNGYSEEIPFSFLRKDSEGGYTPQNLYMARREEKTEPAIDRRLRLVEWDGETHSISEWARITGIPKATISNRLSLGWIPEAALTEPVRRWGR